MSAQKINAKAQKYAENWLPIKSIMNGAIQVDGGFNVTGVKIQPKNIFIMDSQSQSNAIFNLRNFYNTIDYEFWLIVADRPVDVNVYLSQLQLLYNSVQTPAMRKLIMQDIDKGNTFITNNIVDTEYYILFKEKDPNNVQKKVRMLINGLASCGLNASQTTNDDLRIILDNFLNGGKTTEFGTVMPV